MPENRSFDLAVAGGGLAGLSLAIQIAGQGYSVIVFEKDHYPVHKVCGEYISMESWNFLHDLGIDLSSMNLPRIKKIQISSPSGKSLEHKMPLGGFGISRYLLDQTLAQLATGAGALVMTNTRVNDIQFNDNSFNIQTSAGDFSASLAAGCFGKRSNIDVKWKRTFIQKKPDRLNNFVGVKYHIETDFPGDSIALHHFKDGYCGLVKIENGLYNLCYLTRATNLLTHGNIAAMERNVLMRNPFLKKIFSSSRFVTQSPVTISQISFAKKEQVEKHLLMIGDAAGMITPLCGNGMSMAFHASKILAEQMTRCLQGQINRKEMEDIYTRQWRKLFSSRLRMGRTIQKILIGERMSGILIGICRSFPFLLDPLIRRTHGNPF